MNENVVACVSIVLGGDGRGPAPSSNIQLRVKGGMLSVIPAVLVDSVCE